VGWGLEVGEGREEAPPSPSSLRAEPQAAAPATAEVALVRGGLGRGVGGAAQFGRRGGVLI
jgi:hypothetical protein